jgi:hypothetical protein
VKCRLLQIDGEPERVVLEIQDDERLPPRPIEMDAEDGRWIARLIEDASAPAPPPVETLPGLDVPRLIHLVRQSDPDAVQEAYRRTFGSELGRFVLAHHASLNGVGHLWEGPLSADDSNYRHGAQDAALKLALTAGFDSSAMAVMVLTERLEGSDHDDNGQFGLGDGPGHGDWDGDGD